MSEAAQDAASAPALPRKPLEIFVAQRALLYAGVASACVFARQAMLQGAAFGNPGELLRHAPVVSGLVRWDGHEWLAKATHVRSPVQTDVAAVGALYPGLVAAAAKFVPLPVAGLLISNTCALAAALTIAAFARREADGAEVDRTLWLCLCLPSAYLLSGVNPTALVLLGASLVFLGRSRGSSPLAAAGVFAGTLASPAAAILLTAPFVADWVSRRGSVRGAPWYVLAAIPAALLDRGAFQALVLRAPSVPLFRLGPTTDLAPEAVPAVVAWLAVLGGTLLLARQRRVDLALYSGLCLVLPWLSLATFGRAALLAFPACMALARLPRVSDRALLVFAPLQLLAATLYATGLSSD